MLSPGCGADTWPTNDRYTIESSAMMREYVLDVPTDYDPNRAYRLVFGWHWRGGNADNVVNGSGEAARGAYYGLKSRSNGSAIFVSPEGLVDNGVSGWANPQGRDIEFLRDMLDRLNAELCIDQERIFSTGFSYGGMMSFAVGCAMGGVVRAIAPMAGALISGCEDGSAPVAFWGSHAPGDSVVGIDQGRQGRDEFLQRNGCDTQTQPAEPDGCVAYQGCASGYPVTWCEFSGDHYTPDFAPDATWDFFSQF
jgi:poly(3-hydroxybutyrate) depolymerase